MHWCSCTSVASIASCGRCLVVASFFRIRGHLSPCLSHSIWNRSTWICASNTLVQVCFDPCRWFRWGKGVWLQKCCHYWTHPLLGPICPPAAPSLPILASSCPVQPLSFLPAPFQSAWWTYLLQWASVALQAWEGSSLPSSTLTPCTTTKRFMVLLLQLHLQPKVDQFFPFLFPQYLKDFPTFHLPKKKEKKKIVWVIRLNSSMN